MSDRLRGVLLDIDGVLEFHGKACPGAIDAVRALQERRLELRVVSNSTMKSQSACAERLRQHGFEFADEQVFTAASLTAEYLRRAGAKSCWAMVDGTGVSEFAGFEQDVEQPEYVVIGDNRSAFDFEHLNRALRAVMQGSRLIGMQPELLDLSQGALELNVGSWVGMLERATGVQATYIGKPNAFAFEVPMESMNLSRQQVAIVGDQISTDVLGASEFGIRSVLIRAGEYRAIDPGGDAAPDYAVDNISEAAEILLRL